MVKGMAPGSVIVDLAAERGGNCELTTVDEVVEAHGVTIVGPSNVPSTVPFHASQMWSKNISNFLNNMLTKDKEKKFDLEQEDDIIAATWLTKGGEVVHESVQELLSKQGGQD
jgi:NAD(P) transhydrogenase subunit alpha